jgi:UDP-N-acetylglucosamine 2-epimerase (non-hydrolysing)
MRNNTERPITCEVGTNFLVGNNPAKVLECAWKILGGEEPKGKVHEKWDGKAAGRIVEVLLGKSRNR